MNAIRNFFYKIRLRNQKRRALFEVKQDIKYIKIFKGTMLKYDETKARKRMAELKAKENRDDKEDQELDHILDVIAESKATKNEYNQSVKLEHALLDYLSCL